MAISPQKIPCINVNKEYSSVGPLQHTTKKFPEEPASLWSGTGAITVITSESQHYLHCSPLFPRQECVRLGLGNAATLYCPSLALPFFLFTHFCSIYFLFLPFDSFLTSFLPFMAHSFTFFSLSHKNTCSYILPYLVLFVKQNLFQWDGNQMKGNHAVTVQLLIVPPLPHPLY